MIQDVLPRSILVGGAYGILELIPSTDYVSVLKPPTNDKVAFM